MRFSALTYPAVPLSRDPLPWGASLATKGGHAGVFRLRGSRYEAVERDAAGWLDSLVLGVRLRRVGLEPARLRVGGRHGIMHPRQHLNPEVTCERHELSA
jgi:hypothetical protein